MGGYATVSEEPPMDASTARSEDVDLQHVETREGQEFTAHVPDWADKAKRGAARRGAASRSDDDGVI